MPMKILFLLKNTGMHERLGMMTLASVLKKRGHAAQLLLTEDLGEEECLAKVKSIAPHVLAYSIMTGEHNYHIDLNKTLRKHYECFSVFGGPHPTFYPEMIKKDKIDAVCLGEGDIFFPELIERLQAGKDFYNVPNFWFKKPDGAIIRNAIGPLPANLDDIPFPDRALIYAADHALRAKGNKMFMAMRGCPYQCTYCFNHAYNEINKGKGAILRMRSVGNLIAEIKQVKANYFLDRVWIQDDTFLLKPKGWLEEFAERLPKEIGLPLICNVRANLMSNEHLGRLLKKMDCRSVCIGVECGNNLIANDVLKRNISNEDIVKSFEILHKHGIKITAQNLLGLPVDNPLEVDRETLDFNIKLRPYFAWSSILYPYPGTEIGKLCVQKGMFDANFEKIHVSNKTESALDFGDLNIKRKIVRMHKLFGLIVQFPFLRPLTRFLIAMPLTQFYTWLYFAFYGYKTIRSYAGVNGFFRTIGYYVLFYFKYVSRLERRRSFDAISRPQTYPNP